MLFQQCLDLSVGGAQSKPHENPGYGDQLHNKQNPQWKHSGCSSHQCAGSPIYLVGCMGPKFEPKAVHVFHRRMSRPLESRVMRLGRTCCMPDLTKKKKKTNHNLNKEIKTFYRPIFFCNYHPITFTFLVLRTSELRRSTACE